MIISVFNSRSPEFKDPFGPATLGTKITFHIKLQRDEAVTKAKLLIEKDAAGLVAGGPAAELAAIENATSIDMKWTGIEASFDIFFCEYTPEESGLYFYWFEITTSDGIKFISLNVHGEGSLSYEKGDMFQQSVVDPTYKTPDWLHGGIMYQIFPDRFYRCGEMLPDKTEGRIFMKDWGRLPPQNEGADYPSKTYFGGNLSGIISKLPYLKSLGVTAIYMNPIFEAHSYHRYNTADYMKIDPLLGNENDFKLLCEKAGEQGIRVILDGVFSHTGADSIYFNRFGRYPDPGAYQSKDSEYYSWFDFKQWPDKYRCWWGFVELPEVNEEENSYLGFIAGENGVLRHWLELGASGWRLDVTDELPDKFLDSIRVAIKETNNENIVIGEVWEDASNKISYGKRRRYLEGRQLDSVMNYPWRTAVIDYIKTGNADALAESVMSLLENYPKETVDVLMNLLGSHDTIRLITCFAGENPVGRSMTWKQNTRLDGQSRETGLRLVRLAAAIQYFLPGVPCIYYGDEAGFEGYEDPFNRQCFMWGEEDTALVSWFKHLGALRGACPALKSGGYRQLSAYNGLFAFERADGTDSVVLAVNMGDKSESLNTEGRLCLSFGGASFEDGVLSLPSGSCAVVGHGGWASGIEPCFE